MGQFLIDGYGPPIRLNGDIHGGGVTPFFRKDIPLEIKPMEGL